jgi:site-specific DNA-adenine methylase
MDNEDLVKIIQLLKEENEKLKNELLLCKNEEQIKSILTKAGVSNEEEVIALIKKSIVIQNEFRKQNPDFYLMEVTERTNLLETQFNIILENYQSLNLTNNLTSRSCAGTYNLDISRCNRSYGKCAIFAVIAAAEGIIPGIIGGI